MTREVWLIGSSSSPLKPKRLAVGKAGMPGCLPEDIELAAMPASPTSALPAPRTPRQLAHAKLQQQERRQQQAQQQEHQVQEEQSGSSSAAAVQPESMPCWACRHSFDFHCEAAAGLVRFAPGSSDRLAWGTSDGVVYVATVQQPPRLLQVLDRHTDRVTDLAWSPDGGLLLSCSQDGSACLWRAEGGDLERSFRNLSGPLGCCCFHPANPNLLLLGTAAGELLALNASTGRLIARAELQAAPMAGVAACCMATAGSGQLLVADSRGCLHLFAITLHDGTLKCLVQLAHLPPASNRFHEPACLQYAPHSTLAGGPVLLVVLSSGEVVLSRVQKPWQLEPVQELRIAAASAKIGAVLRPAANVQHPELLAAGGEDCRVHLIRISQAQHAPHAAVTLSGHRAPVLGMAWSGDGRRLASCDKEGVVRVWEEAAAESCAQYDSTETS